MAHFKLFQFTIFLVMISTLVISQDPPDLENRCGGCPCNNPCNPPPSPPPPPPPSPPPPTPKKPPPSNNCPPPPSGGGGGGGGGGGQFPPYAPFIYINGPPGNLYPVDPNFSGSGRVLSFGLSPLLISFVLGLIALW